MANTPQTAQISGTRIALMVGTIVALLPLTILFGGFGFVAGLAFLVLAALAK